MRIGFPFLLLGMIASINPCRAEVANVNVSTVGSAVIFTTGDNRGWYEVDFGDYGAAVFVPGFEGSGEAYADAFSSSSFDGSTFLVLGSASAIDESSLGAAADSSVTINFETTTDYEFLLDSSAMTFSGGIAQNTPTLLPAGSYSFRGSASVSGSGVSSYSGSLSLRAVPEPNSLCLGLLGCACFLHRRRHC